MYGGCKRTKKLDKKGKMKFVSFREMKMWLKYELSQNYKVRWNKDCIFLKIISGMTAFIAYMCSKGRSILLVCRSFYKVIYRTWFWRVKYTIISLTIENLFRWGIAAVGFVKSYKNEIIVIFLLHLLMSVI